MKEFPTDSYVIIINERNAGSLAQIKGYKDKNTLKVKLLSIPKAYTNNVKELINSCPSQYKSSQEVAQQLGIPERCLKFVADSYTIRIINEAHLKLFDIGLNIHCFHQRQCIPTYTRNAQYYHRFVSLKNSSLEPSWEYTQQAIELLQEHKQRFSEFWQELQQEEWTKMSVQQVMNKQQDNQFCQNLMWLSRLPVNNSFSTQSSTSISLEQQTLESLFTQFNSSQQNQSMEEILVDISQVIRPNDNKFPHYFFLNQQFEVGDQVINLDYSNGMAFGQEGIAEAIIFNKDQLFKSKILVTYEDQSVQSNKRISISVPYKDLLNLTYLKKLYSNQNIQSLFTSYENDQFCIQYKDVAFQKRQQEEDKDVKESEENNEEQEKEREGKEDEKDQDKKEQEGEMPKE